MRMRHAAAAATLAMTTLLGTTSIAGAATIGPREQSVVAEINAYRSSHGLHELALDEHLSDAAEWMGADLAGGAEFSHTDSLGRDPFTRLDALGIDQHAWLGENLAAGGRTPGAAFEQWRNSPPHNANMLLPEYRSVGVARVHNPDSQYGTYWVTEFSSRTPGTT